MPDLCGGRAGDGTVLTAPRRLAAVDYARRHLPGLRAALAGWARLSARAVAAETGMVSIVGAHRAYLVDTYNAPSSFGGLFDIPIEDSFCGAVVSRRETVALTDARIDPAVRDLAVVRDLGLVAYLGVPVSGAGGQPIGALGVADFAPRTWSSEEVALVEDAARMISTMIADRMTTAPSAAKAGDDEQTVRRLTAALDEAVAARDEAIAAHRMAERLYGCDVAVTRLLAQSHSLDDVADSVLELVGGTLGATRTELWLLDRVGGVNRLSNAWTSPTATAGWAAEQPTLSVPLVNKERTFGSVKLYDCPAREPDLIFLEGIATQLAQFVERRDAEDLGLELARTKGEFIALAGHTLRTPLTTIVSLTELLLTAGEDLAGERDALLARIRANAETLRGIVEDLLVLAGLESGHINLSIGPLDLAQLVEDAVAAVAPAAVATGVLVETDLPGELPAFGDRTRLRQAVDNLLSNAVKYSPDGGTVRIRLTSAANVAELIVADEGLGIPPTEREQLFQRFYRGGSAHERGIPGTGLGLPLIRLIAELHGGTIVLTDRDGAGASTQSQGATFTLRLPLRPAGQ